MTRPGILISGLSVTYGTQTALAGVELSCAPGKITALIGPSGCGKSSLLHSINRLTDLVPGCRVSGRIEVDGQDVRAKEVDVIALRRRVGMIFQKPNPFPLSIARNLELPLIEHGLRDAAERRTRVRRALQDVGLWSEVEGRLEDRATDLSGGQQQRLCLARALVLEPEIVLLDEPTSALDPLSGGLVEDLIAGLRERFTVVLVTHDLGQARRLADQIALFWSNGTSGELIEQGTCKQVFEDPQDPRAAAYVAGRRV